MKLKVALLMLAIGIYFGCDVVNRDRNYSPDRNYTDYVYSSTQHQYYSGGKNIFDSTYFDSSESDKAVFISTDGKSVKTSYTSSKCLSTDEYIIKRENDTNFAFYSDPTYGISTSNWIAFGFDKYALEKSISALTFRGCLQLDTVNYKLYANPFSCDTSLHYPIIDSLVLFNRYFPDTSKSKVPNVCI